MADEIEAEVSDPTIGRRTSSRRRVQIIARMAPKRSWTLEQKIAILDEAFAPGARVSDAAERHEINTGQLYTWRQLFLDGKLVASKPPAPAFARVEMVPAPTVISSPALIEPPAATEPAPRSSGGIEIELKSGVRIRVDGDVNGKALKHVLDALRDR
jgi:transposase